jgi:hypothetical protein
MWFRTAFRISAVIAVLGALTLSATAAQASPGGGSRLAQQASIATPAHVESGSEGVAAQVCGYYEDAVTAWYNHCGDTHVIIYVDATWPRDDWSWCIGPGVWDIGGAGAVSNAWYAGQVC